MDIFEPDFDFDALNPAFQDMEAEFPELDMELMEGDFDDETDDLDEDGIFDADEDEVEDPDDDFPEMLEYTDWQEDMYAGEDGFYHNDSGSDW